MILSNEARKVMRVLIERLYPDFQQLYQRQINDLNDAELSDICSEESLQKGLEQVLGQPIVHNTIFQAIREKHPNLAELYPNLDLGKLTPGLRERLIKEDNPEEVLEPLYGPAKKTETPYGEEQIISHIRNIGVDGSTPIKKSCKIAVYRTSTKSVDYSGTGTHIRRKEAPK